MLMVFVTSAWDRAEEIMWTWSQILEGTFAAEPGVHRVGVQESIETR